MPPKYPANAPQAPEKHPKQPGDTSMAGAAPNPLAGLPGLPPDLREFLRSRSVAEIAKLMQLGKGTASRIKRGIYPLGFNQQLTLTLLHREFLGTIRPFHCGAE